MSAKFIRKYSPGAIHNDLYESLRITDVSKRLAGYVEAHGVGALTILCDEDGKLKGLEPTLQYEGFTFVGDIYVGYLNDDGLQPVSKELINVFESQVVLI